MNSRNWRRLFVVAKKPLGTFRLILISRKVAGWRRYWMRFGRICRKGGSKSFREWEGAQAILEVL